MSKVIAAAVVAWVTTQFQAGTAMAQNSCAAYMNTAVNAQEFNVIADALAKVPSEKGEFETSVDFASRKAAAMSGLPARALIKLKIDPNEIKYNADSQRFDIKTYTFDNRRVAYNYAFGYGNPHYQKIEFGSYNNIDVVINYTEEPNGVYAATNGFGAQTNVQQVTRIIHAVWEKSGGYNNEEGELFTQAHENFLPSLSVAQEQAKAFKDGASAVVVIEPKPPFLAKGSHTWPARFDSPTEVNEQVTVIVADIQCVLLTDATNAVVAAYPTK